MTSGTPWSVKGIDPKAREIAKDLARRSGMTLGEWLNQVILEDTVADEPGPPVYGSDRWSADRRKAFAGDPSYRRIETPSHPGDDVLGVREALDRLSARIEAAEHRSTLAISGIDQSVTGLVSRLGGAEREQTVVAARFEGAVDDLRQDHARMVERLRRIENEAAGPRSIEALRAMEGALAKVATHVYDGEERTRETAASLRQDIDSLAERLATGLAGTGAAELVDSVVARISERLEQAEGRTTAALRSLETSFGHLDERLRSAEHRLDGKSADIGLEQLAVSLTARVDAARAEMAEKIRGAADGRFDRMERTLQEMTGHVQTAERRSAEAIEKMGHEVMRVADVLNRKVEDVEHRSAGAIEQAMEQVGGKVARIADAMETRLARVDSAGAQALEKLGGEIARITERLAERIADAERRSAQAIDDVGDQLSRVTDRMQDRQERVTTELGERIRQSEERTARLLEDARARIDERLAETNRRLETAKPAAEPTYAAQAYVDAPYLSEDIAPFGHDSFSTPPAAAHSQVKTLSDVDAEILIPADFDDQIFAPAEPAVSFADQALAAHNFAAQPFAIHAPLDEPYVTPANAAASSADHDIFGAEPDEVEPLAFEAAPADHEPLEASVRENDLDHLGDAEDYDPEDQTPSSMEDPMEAMFAPPPPPPTARDLIQQARAASRAAAEPKPRRRTRNAPIEPSAMFAGMTATHKPAKRQQGSSLMTAVFATGALAALSVAVAGYVISTAKPAGPMPERVAEALGAKSPATESPKPAADATTDLAAEALVQGVSGGPGAADQGLAIPAAAPTAPSADAIALYGDGARRIEAHDFTGVKALTKSANLGYAPAQFYLAKLYEEGSAGLKKDSAEARRWTERAAEGGDRKAMHNLALYYFEGTGGPKNTTTAAAWFHRAADLGLTDSQYNLGRLYEEGFGVAQNPAEAYKWYLIAAQGGDGESRASAQRVKGQLSAEAQSAAERAAQSFHAEAPGAAPTAVAQAAASPEAVAQRALSHLGYYQGPTDGAASPALKFAIAAYQRDQGLPPTGALDPALNDRLALIAQ